MEELIDLIVTDGSPTDVSDSIKQLLYAKAAERINYATPLVASAMFGDNESPEEENGDFE